MTDFGLDNYKSLEAKQQPSWPDPVALERIKGELANQPPLVFAGEVDTLRERLAKAAAGEAFLLQGGDCAETFADATADRIRNRIKTVLQMAVVLMYGSSLPVIKMGRMAGQFSKPRSSDSETRDGLTLPAYRGDAVNGYEFTEQSRTANPQRLLDAYHTSASTLNLIRAFTTGGFADLREVHAWNRGFTDNPANKRYESIAGDIDRAMKFMEACGVDSQELKATEFFVSHEGLLFDYERPLTRIDSRTGLPYVTSGHFIWIGERTRQLDGAHIDFFSRVRNPIGVKLGPTTQVDDVLRLIDQVDGNREPGRLTLIHRFGSGKIAEHLPPMIEAVRATGATVLWTCDPMHGNTESTSSGIKTRSFDRILSEVEQAFRIHEEMGSYLGGVHFELTGDDVTECIGGARGLTETDLARAYHSQVDPRLNYEQALELAMRIAELRGR